MDNSKNQNNIKNIMKKTGTSEPTCGSKRKRMNQKREPTGEFKRIVATSTLLMLFLSSVLTILSVVPGDASGDGGRGDLPDLMVDESGVGIVGVPAVGETVTIEAVVLNIGNMSIEHWQVTDEDYDQASPSFSPEGKYIAYASEEDSDSFLDIWVMDIDGSNHTQLTNDNTHAVRPFYSHDSKYIYYSENTPNWDIHKMDANGDNNIQIIGGSGDQIAGDISPDSKEIVYFISNSDLWIANADGTEKRELTTDGKPRGWPSFNSEGTNIVYTSGQDGGGYQDVWILTKKGDEWDSTSTSQQISYENFSQEDAYFTPSNDKIIYDSQENGDGIDDIWIMDSNGENHIQLTTEDHRQASPYISNDGKNIIYASYEDGDSNFDIWQLNATATATVSVYDGDPDNGGTLIGTDKIAIWANASARVKVEWTPMVGGTHKIFVVVDDVEPGDGNESNNVAWKSVEVVDHGVWQRMDEEPSARDEFAMAYDSKNNVVVLFGGIGASDEKYADTWIYDISNNIWIEKNPLQSPTARFGHAMAFNSITNEIILFGGTDESGQLQDTWVYDVKTDTWVQKHPMKYPSQRRCHAMVYDSAADRIVLFGGLNDTDRLEDTWAYDVAAKTWTQQTPASKPSARYVHRMVYDPFNEIVVLFGGYDGDNDDETWLYELDSDKWTKKDPAIKPSARYGQGMVYDLSAKKVVLFGGYDGNNDAETWLYDVDSNTWTKENPDQAPSARHYLAMVYDSANEKSVLFGGNNPDKLDDTWFYDYPINNWTQRGQIEKPSPRREHAMVYDSVNARVVLFGGDDDGLNNETWIYDVASATWTFMGPSTQPSARRRHAMAYDSANEKVVLFGGYDGSLDNETWIYDLGPNIWTKMNPLESPSPREAHRMVYDSADKKIVLFGGYDGSNIDETWAYDLQSDTWTKMNPSTKPSARENHGMAYDSANNKVVLFGGYDGSNDDETWVYDLASDIWTKKNPSTSPSARRRLGMAYDSANDKVVIFGRHDTSGRDETWVYDLANDTWTLKNPTTKPSGRKDPAMVYDSVNNRIVLFGGDDGSSDDETWTYYFSSTQSVPPLTLTTDHPTYTPGGTVEVTASYTGDQTDITFDMEYPNGATMLTNTTQTNETGISTHSFTLPTDAPTGTYIIHANTTDAITSTTFEVVPPPLAIIDSITPDPALLGEEVTFKGRGIHYQNISRYVWRSDLEGELFNSSTIANFSVNGLGLGHHTIFFRIQGEDGYWSENAVGYLDITTQPAAIIDRITPNPGNEGEDIDFYYNGTDDGSIQRYVWYTVPGGAFYNGSNTHFVTSFDEGVHTLFYKVQDDLGLWSEVVSENLTVIGNNTPPIIHSVIIESSDAPHTYESSILYAAVNVTDPDNDTLEYNYSWFVNDILIEVGSSVINGTYYEKGDIVSLSVTVSDGLLNASNDSPGLVIENLAPVVTNVKIIPGHPITTDNLSLEYTFSDLDGDSENGTIYRWYRNGIFSGITGNVVSDEQTNVGESWKCQIIPSDGDDMGQSVQTDSVTIREISDVHGVEITAEKYEINLEESSEKILIVTVKNTGLVEDSYTFSLSGSYQGWNVTIESPDEITLAPGEESSFSFILADDPDDDSKGEKITVVITVKSVTHEEVQDSVTITGSLPDDSFIDLPPALVAPAIGIAGVVAFFRRRKLL